MLRLVGSNLSYSSLCGVTDETTAQANLPILGHSLFHEVIAFMAVLSWMNYGP
jgi:hypothetical protein